MMVSEKNPKKPKGKVHNYTLEMKKYQWMRKKWCNLLVFYKIHNNQFIKFKIHYTHTLSYFLVFNLDFPTC